MIKPVRSTDPLDYGFYLAASTFTGTSDTIYLMSGSPTVSAAIHPASGTAKVQYTISSAAEIEAGRGKWIDWPKGSVPASAADALVGAVVAIRGVATATATIEVCAQ